MLTLVKFLRVNEHGSIDPYVHVWVSERTLDF